MGSGVPTTAAPDGEVVYRSSDWWINTKLGNKAFYGCFKCVITYAGERYEYLRVRAGGLNGANIRSHFEQSSQAHLIIISRTDLMALPPLPFKEEE